MPISLICSCGARLEIDDKFAGQSIPCPDCNKPIVAEPAVPAPTRTSGLAIVSLLLALVGAFTVVGTLAAIVCGAVAHRQLKRQRGSVGGVRLAQAGMILGALFTVLALAAYGSRSLLGIDRLMRQYWWAGKLTFSPQLTIIKKRANEDFGYSLERPSMDWGVEKPLDKQKDIDYLMFVNVRDDAQILWLLADNTENADPAGRRARAIECFKASDFVRQIGRLPDTIAEPRGVDDALAQQEFFLDITLGGIPRTFLFRLVPDDRSLNVLVGGTRARRFDKLLPIFRAALDSRKQEVGR